MNIHMGLKKFFIIMIVSFLTYLSVQMVTEFEEGKNDVFVYLNNNGFEKLNHVKIYNTLKSAENAILKTFMKKPHFLAAYDMNIHIII